MKANEYFGEYWKCIDKAVLSDIMNKLKVLYSTKLICPEFKNVFKAFEECPYSKLKVVILGQDPYPQRGVATGLAFANKAETKKLSPSLEILKESVINFEVPHNYITFVPSLEEWANQGVLLLNSALTVEENKVGSHSNLWKPFIESFLLKLSLYNPGLIYMLFGQRAISFKKYILSGNILEEAHPSYYARLGVKMPSTIFNEANRLLKLYWDSEINWYKEYEI